MQYVNTCVVYLCCQSGEWTRKRSMMGLRGHSKSLLKQTCVICCVVKEKTPEP